MIKDKAAGSGLMRIYRSVTSSGDLGFRLLAVFIFVLPVFVLPFWNLPLDTSKKFLAVFVATLLIIIWSVARLQSRTLTVDTNPLLIGACFLTLAWLAASLLAVNVGRALFGFGFERTTFLSLLTFTVLFAGAYVFINDKNRLTKFYLVLFASFLVVFLLQVLQVFFRPFANLSFFGPLAGGSGAFTLIGKWNELSLFSGFISISVLAALELMPLEKFTIFRRLLVGILVLALLLTAIANFYLSWIILAATSLLLFIYLISRNYGATSVRTENQTVPFKIRRPSFYVVLLALVFVLVGGSEAPLNNYIDQLNQKLGILSIEVSPNIETTSALIKEAVKESPLGGAGPNHFYFLWSKAKPASSNQGLFWDIDFVSGSGFIPTMLVEGGVFAAVAIILFLGSLLLVATRFLTRQETNLSLGILPLVGSFYWWLALLFYVPDTLGLSLTFIISGIFAASATGVGLAKKQVINLKTSHRSHIFITLFLVICLLLGVSLTFFASSRLWAIMLWRRGETTSRDPTTYPLSQELFLRSLALSEQDVTYRALAEATILEAGRVSADTSLSPDVSSPRLQSLVAQAVFNGHQAVEVNPLDYRNFLSLGQLYASLAVIGVEGAYDQAVKLYDQAMVLAPFNPIAPFVRARLEFSLGNNQAARSYSEKSLTLKQDFLDNLFLISQIDLSEGKGSQAAERVTKVLAINDSPILWFQLGFLRYRLNNFAAAAAALNEAVARDQSFSNARYFLGLTYDRLGKKDEAIAEFEAVAALNPNNDELENILNNLRAGRSALFGLNANAPEDKTKLPVAESN